MTGNFTLDNFGKNAWLWHTGYIIKLRKLNDTKKSPKPINVVTITD